MDQKKEIIERLKKLRAEAQTLMEEHDALPGKRHTMIPNMEYRVDGRYKVPQQNGVIKKFGIGVEEKRKQGEEDIPTNKKCNKTWAKLIQKVYEVDPMVCPKCNSQMKIVSIIFDTDEIKPQEQ